MIEAQIRARFAPDVPHMKLAEAGHRPAAVLVAIEPGRGVWLTKRTAHLAHHAGQVAFPGGKVELFDDSIIAASLREAGEEIGLRAQDTQVLGRLDDFITGTGFHISPVVALVPPGVQFYADPHEVDAIFCLPFAVLLDHAQPRLRQAVFKGEARQFYQWPHDEFIIWGATARILLSLALRLRRPDV